MDSFIDEEQVAGSGTAWTLENTPETGSVDLYAEGQRLMPGTDYFIAGAAISTVQSWPAGSVFADYRI